MGVCGCVIPNPNCHCHSMPNYLVTMPKSVLDQINKEHTEEIERLRQQVAELVYAVKWIVTEDERSDPFRMACAIDHAKEMLAKATGEPYQQ